MVDTKQLQRPPVALFLIGIPLLLAALAAFLVVMGLAYAAFLFAVVSAFEYCGPILILVAICAWAFVLGTEHERNKHPEYYARVARQKEQDAFAKRWSRMS